MYVHIYIRVYRELYVYLHCGHVCVYMYICVFIYVYIMEHFYMPKVEKFQVGSFSASDQQNAQIFYTLNCMF